MTLHELFEQLGLEFPLSIRKDLKTGVRVLAQTLGYPDPQACPLEACHQPLATICELVGTYLISQGKGRHTIKNTKTNLKRFFLLAAQQNLFSLLPPTLTKQFDPEAPHSRPGAEYSRHDGTYLLRPQWPPALEADFAAFSKWATDPLVPGRDGRWRKRLSTIDCYERLFTAYFGYLHHVLKIPNLSFDTLFNIELISSYITWHISIKHKRPTIVAHQFLSQLQALTRQYHPDPDLRKAVKSIQQSLPKPAPTFNKTDVWVPLTTIQHVAKAIWPRKPPHLLEHNGRLSASYASWSLLLHLWTYIPYRARNMREMKLNHNLFKDGQGQWRIRFTGDELKVAVKRGHTNIFDVPFPNALIPTLEEYHRTWRPILATIHNAQEVFLTNKGTPLTDDRITQGTKNHICRYTGKRLHPHLIRTIWATEWIRDKNPGDFYGAAVMLNDTLQTVINRYAHLLDDGIAGKVYERLGQHYTGSR